MGIYIIVVFCFSFERIIEDRDNVFEETLDTRVLHSIAWCMLCFLLFSLFVKIQFQFISNFFILLLHLLVGFCTTF